MLAHELQHAQDHVRCIQAGVDIRIFGMPGGDEWLERNAIRTENTFKWYYRHYIDFIIPTEFWDSYKTPGCDTFLLPEQTPPWEIISK